MTWYGYLALIVGNMKWLRRLGGPGLILLGIADSSVVPLPGSMDVALLWLTAHHRSWWPYYAAMAILGAVAGGYITYAIARKGGKKALERKLPKEKARKIFKKFEHRGFSAVMISALLPPPFPLVPVLLAAGALQYPRKKFLVALTIGRGLRFTILAGLGLLYGNQITAFFAQYYKPALFILIGLAVVGSLVALVQYLRSHARQGERVDDQKAA
jgi:membrane protein YqaA with SNARE-associated domain